MTQDCYRLLTGGFLEKIVRAACDCRLHCSVWKRPGASSNTIAYRAKAHEACTNAHRAAYHDSDAFACITARD
jgi:hypothetical protein